MKNHQELKIKRGKLKKETDIFPTRVKDPPHKKTVDPNKTITVFLKIKQIQAMILQTKKNISLVQINEEVLSH